MTRGESRPTAASRYWKYALWLTATLTLLALMAIQMAWLPIQIGHITVAVAFSLLSSACMCLLIGKATRQGRLPIGPLLAYALGRLLVAVALILGYMLGTHARGMQLLPFVGVLVVFFIVIDVLDAAFLVKLQKTLDKS